MITDPVTGERTLLGITRAARPNEFRDGPTDRCPFCPGNEDQTPPEIARYGDASAWRARAFANKFPAIEPPAGIHEVIVDGSSHDAEITVDGMRMWRERYLAARACMPGAWPVLFKNSGAYAGATIVHPHTQMLVIPEIPVRWNAMRTLGTAHLQRTGTCAWCEELVAAGEEGSIVAEKGAGVAFVRAASRFAWALTIAPRECAPSLDQASDAQWAAMTDLLQPAVRAVQATFGERCAFNVLVASDPHAQRRAFHWHLELIPRVATLAGFELSTGMFIRGASAKESAQRWRRMLALPHGSI